MKYFEVLQLCGGEMERTGVGVSDKIRSVKGAPRSLGSAATSLTAEFVGNSTRKRSVAEDNDGLKEAQSG